MLDLLTKPDVCSMLRCSTRTFDRWRSLWRARGIDIGEVRIRRRTLFRREKIERLVNSPRLWLN